MKRKRHELESSIADNGMGAALARLRNDGSIQNGDEATHVESSTDNFEEPLQVKQGMTGKDKAWQNTENRTARKRRKKLEKNYPVLTHSPNARPQSFIKLSDIQALILYLFADGTSPQWISVRHHQNFDKIVLLLVPGLDREMFEKKELQNQDISTMNGTNGALQSQNTKKTSPDDYYPTQLVADDLCDTLQPIAEIFSHLWPVKAPGEYKRMHSPIYALLSSPLARTKEEKNAKGVKSVNVSVDWRDKNTPVTEFLTSKTDLLENDFALHPVLLASDTELEIERQRRFKAVQSPADGWIDLPSMETMAKQTIITDRTDPILQGRQVLVIDCEMVTTTVDRFALARVSLLDWKGVTIFDSLVKPSDPVQDYLTPYSGITKEMLDATTFTLQDVQNKLTELLTANTILAGHSLDSDLRALKMSFPFVVDTALLYPHPRGPPQKSSLKWLTQKYLGREIQKNNTLGHDSVEDAQACLDLIKQKCEKGKAWGTNEAQGESIFRRLARTGKTPAPGGGQRDAPKAIQGDQDDIVRKSSAMIDWRGNAHGFSTTATVSIQCTDDDEVVQAIKDVISEQSPSTVQDRNTEPNSSQVDESVNQNSNSAAYGSIPAKGIDFTFARLRALEYARGWTPSTRTDLRDPEQVLTSTISNIKSIYDALPERTAFIVLSGSGDPREMIRLQQVYARYKEEYSTKKWDELSVKWTDVEEQALKAATERARLGIGFITVK